MKTRPTSPTTPKFRYVNQTVTMKASFTSIGVKSGIVPGGDRGCIIDETNVVDYNCS